MSTTTPAQDATYDKTRPLPFVKMSREIVMLRVTKEDKTQEFAVHEDALFNCSDYFVKAFGPETFEESQTRVLDLEDVCPETIGRFLDWVYTRSINRLHFCVDLCDFTDRFGVKQLYTDAFTAVYAFFNTGPASEELPIWTEVTTAFQKLPEHHKLRKFFADVHVRIYGVSFEKKVEHKASRASVSKEFGVDFAPGLAEKSVEQSAGLELESYLVENRSEKDLKRRRVEDNDSSDTI